RVREQGPQLGKDGDHLRCRRRQHVSHDSGRHRPGEHANEIEQRRIRNRAFRLETRAVQDEKSGGARFVDHRAKEPRLPDARFADDQRDVSTPIARAREHAVHRRELVIAADERWANDIISELHGDTRCRDEPLASMAALKPSVFQGAASALLTAVYVAFLEYVSSKSSAWP